MSDRPLTESAAAESQETSPAPHGTPKTTRVPSAPPWLTYVALVIAVVAAVLGGLAYFHPAHSGAAGTAQQGGDAKANVCAAYAAAHRAVVISTHLQSPNPDLQLSIAANARLALIGGGAYLNQRLAANTAAPADLTSAAKSFSDALQQLGINYINESPPDVMATMRKDLDSQIANLDKMCA